MVGTARWAVTARKAGGTSAVGRKERREKYSDTGLKRIVSQSVSIRVYPRLSVV
jgi:hypothetical protein